MNHQRTDVKMRVQKKIMQDTSAKGGSPCLRFGRVLR